MTISTYDRTELEKIHLWKNPQLTWFDAVMETINYPLEKAGEFMLDAPLVGEAVKKSIKGIIDVSNDLAQWSVRPEAIFSAFDGCGKPVKLLEDIWDLDLSQVDRTIGFLAAKYKGIALAEGAATGVAGLPGIPMDIAALITINLRAIGEYATYCGFDVSHQEERLFAMNVLGYASSPTDSAKQVAMAQLVKIAQDVAKKKAWKDLQKSAFTKIIQNIAKALSIRLTKAKLAQIIPITGAAVGGGFNAYYTSKVCDAAFFLYRERFLARKYGKDVIEATVKPAETFDTDYGEEVADAEETA